VRIDDVLCVDEDGRFVRPGAGYIARGVPATAADEEREVECFHEGDAGTVRAHVEVKAAQAVAAEGVCAALQNDGARAVGLDGGANDFLEELDVGVVIDPVVEGHVEGVVSAWVERVIWAGGVEGAGAREEVVFVVFVEGDCEDAVCGPEGLLDAVAVVHVDVDVHDSRVVTKELQDAEDDVVDVAEAGCFCFFGVVQAARPVYCDFGLVVTEFAGGVDGAACVEGAVVVEAVKDRAVVAEVEARDVIALVSVLDVPRDHLFEEIEVV